MKKRSEDDKPKIKEGLDEDNDTVRVPRLTSEDMVAESANSQIFLDQQNLNLNLEEAVMNESQQISVQEDTEYDLKIQSDPDAYVKSGEDNFKTTYQAETDLTADLTTGGARKQTEKIQNGKYRQPFREVEETTSLLRQGDMGTRYQSGGSKTWRL